MPSDRFKNMSAGFDRLEKTFLTFKGRPNGDYTPRQLSMAAAYTIFCHAEIEIFIESWAGEFVDVATSNWNMKKATRPLVHLCTFHEGRQNINSVPVKDIWNEIVIRSISKHRGIISSNHGIKESNVCELFSPIGFDTTKIDGLLLADLSAFGNLRGQHAHNSLKSQIGTIFDPFDRRTKVFNLRTLLLVLDSQLESYLASV